MKRSEVVSKIEAFLKGYEDPGFQEEREDDADALLSMIEKIGMLPPDTGKGRWIGTQYMSTHLDYSQAPDNRWEPENEKG